MPPPSLSAFSLWDHQREAVLRLREYVKAHQNGTTNRAALVHVPTGAGKTGIIALLTRLTPTVGNSLVLAPRLALRDQLGRDVERRFFEKLAKCPRLSKIPKAVRVWNSPPKKTEVDGLADTVVIATIQAFHRWSTRPGPGKRLKDRIDLLVVDEGHCEPAPQWRQVLRTVSKPTVLFTATPYRNDLKAFDIDYDYAVGLTHGEALDEKILRQLSVRDRPTPASPNAFVDDVLDQYEKLFGTIDQDDPEAPRVIIRCEAHDRIRQIGKALEAKGLEYVAVHEQFRDRRDHEFRHVPNPATTKALVWVHQFKMVEGIDDARFRLVALYDPIRNTRMLIQQIGRVLRNPDRDEKQEAYLLDHHRSLHGREWTRYLAYDEMVRTHGVKAILEPTQQLLKGILGVLPPVAYLDRTFRTPLDLSTLDPKEDLRFPKSTNVFRYDKTVSIGDMTKSIKDHCDERDLPVTIYPVGPDTLVAVYFVHRNSPYLDGSFFLDAWLGVSIVHLIGEWMFVFDSDGAVPGDLPGMGEAVPPAKLRRVFQDQTLTRLTHVSVRNSNLSSTAVRTRAFTAVSIRETLPSPDDRGSVCSTAEGYTPRAAATPTDPDDLVRRYVGFRSGRISDYDGAGCRLDEYLSWLGEIGTRLQSTAKVLPEFVRYAQESPVPPDSTPTHILLDAAEILDRYVTIPDSLGAAGEQLTIEDRAIAVSRVQKGEGEFTITANGKGYLVGIRYDVVRRKYILSAPDLDGAYRPSNLLHPEGIVRLLNALQGFRLLTESRGYFYTHGQFYHPEVEFGPSYDDDQLGVFRVLVPISELRTMGSEKGDHSAPPHNRWPTDSLFGLVQDLGGTTALATHIGKPTHLVCDDLESESADFILADSARSVVAFVHAKASGSWRPCSASELEVVCGQAMKNVRYLAKFTTQDAPVNAPKWGTKDWKIQKRVVSRVLRAPRGVTGLVLWEEIHRLIRDPHAQCEVWLLLGQMFSAKEFRKRLTASPPEPEAVQAAYLLLSTMTSAYSVGARLRVFCSP